MGGGDRMFVRTDEELDDEARRISGRWGWYVAGGGLVLLLGIFLLANPFSAVRTLALLVALDLALEGMDHIVNAPRYRVRWAAYLLGALYLVTGIVAVSWPGITLWALALIVGVGLVIGGGVQLLVVTLFHRDLPNRWVFLAMGVLTVLTGLLALSWPGATVLVLAIVLGIRVATEGVSLVMFGLGLREVHRELGASGVGRLAT
jgi:uncharacterized membrane protein HdeD (DUF308 family)